MQKKTSFVIRISFSCILLIFVYVAINFSVKNPLVGIRYNISESLPFSYFFSTRFREPFRDSFIAMDHPGSLVRLAKQIKGLPGDKISVRADTVYINDDPIGVVQAKSKSGTSFTPIQERDIPEGRVFVYASHPFSFDSRYQEFGLVKLETIKERLWPLF